MYNNLLHPWSDRFSCFPVKQRRNYCSTKEENRSELPIVRQSVFKDGAQLLALQQKNNITHCPSSFLRSFGTRLMNSLHCSSAVSSCCIVAQVSCKHLLSASSSLRQIITSVSSFTSFLHERVFIISMSIS